MDRFDEMRAKIIKRIESSNYNVFTQLTEPEIKEGIWIKEDMTPSNIAFLTEIKTGGSFLDTSKLDEICNNTGSYAFRLVGDYLYLFSNTPDNARKYNLISHKFEGDLLSLPSISYTLSLGSLIYNNLIYVFYQKDGTIYYYSYDYENNTYSEPTQIGSVRRFNSTNWTSNIVSDGQYAYFISSTYTSSSYYYDVCKINLSNMSMSKKENNGDIFRKQYNIAYYDGFIYFTAYSSAYGKKTIKVLNCSTLAISDLCVVSLGTSSFSYTLCAYNGYIYVFQGGISTTTYAKIDISNKTYEILEAPFPIRTNAEASHPDIFQFHEASGIMYGFYKYSETTPKCLAIQVIASVNYEENTLLLLQDNSGYKVKIDSKSNLYATISNTYLVKNGILDEQHSSYYGDGASWNAIKEV